MRKRQFAIVFAALAALAAVAIGSPVKRINEIQAPLLSTPAIVRAGDSFALKIRVSGDKTLTEVVLDGVDNPETRISLPFAKKGEAYGDAVFSATVPTGTPTALYDLAARFGTSQWDRQLHAVKVIGDFKKEFDFVHITDIHFNVNEVTGQDMERIRKRLFMDINKLNPEFVVFSGDLGLDPETYDRDYVHGYEMFAQWLRVPMFMVPGNHEQYYAKAGENNPEIDGRDYWTSNYGPTYRSFDYGAVHVVGINDFDWPQVWRERRGKDAMFFGTVINAVVGDEQMDWLKSDLEAAKSRGARTFAFTHIPIETLMGGKKIGMPPNKFKVPGPNTDSFVKLLTSNGCDYIFVGHVHFNEEKKVGAIEEITTKAAGISGDVNSKWGYRVVHVKDGMITGTTIHEVGFKDL
jgi:hypothetical protein